MANLVYKSPSLSTPILFQGLKQSNKYRENILNGLWNYQLLNKTVEQAFNQWLSKCAICYLFNANKLKTESLIEIRNLLMLDEYKNKSNISNDLLKCNSCYVRVHRECYETICLALNVQITDIFDQWCCQRCILRKQVLS